MLFTFNDSNQDRSRYINKENYFCSVSYWWIIDQNIDTSFIDVYLLLSFILL